ncbi:MAG: protein kinase domain-containing protein [Planctomycetota bacterium]
MPDPIPDPLQPLIQRWLQSDEPDALLEELCEQHPEHADALRARLAGRVHSVARDGVRTGAAESPGEPEQIGRYRILDTLGEGGMGTVYLAEQTEPVQRRVALKLIKLGMDTKAVVQRFEQERQALAVMDHEGIAKVYDVGTSERGQPYFVMELVRGIPLDKYCERHRLSLQGRLELMQQVCAAVQHAHQKGVIHRDLKPGNVLVGEVDGRRQVKVIDFGLAKAMGQKLIQESLFTELGVVMGTPEYMAPEQADPSNLDVDTRADVYSLGVMLYQLLVGQLPFSSEELREAGLFGLQRLLREIEPVKPSHRLTQAGQSPEQAATQLRMSSAALRRALRNDLDWVVVKALEKDRVRRYQSAAALGEDLQRYRDLEPLEAGPPSVAYRLQKLLRRHAGAFAAAAMVLLALLGGGVATYVWWQDAVALARENAALADSERAAKEAAASSAARFAAKVTEFDQLAGVVRYQEVLAALPAVLQLGPWPQAQPPAEAWLRDCDELLAMRAGIDAAIASLREQAVPWDAASEAAFAAREPEAYRRWQLQAPALRSLDYAHAVRSGREERQEVTLTDEQRGLDAAALQELAWARVAPEPTEREVWGEEALGLALAQLAAEKALGDPAHHEYLRTLAWAELANGGDDLAQRCIDAALAAAPQRLKQDYDASRRALAAAIEEAPARLAAAIAARTERPVWEFAPSDKSQAFLHRSLSDLRIELARLENEQRAQVDARMRWSAEIERLTRAHPNARVTWSVVREGVARSSLYAGCDVPLGDADVGSRWLGLVPIGANPVTGLYEFYHLRSACDGDVAAAAQVEIPVHGADGAIEVDEATGVVFVLLPGGRVTLGSQADDEGADLYDPDRQPRESLHEVELSPFLLARHELTQGQWARLWAGGEAGREPSGYRAGMRADGRRLTAAHPVERVDWSMSRDLARSYGLVLPTEAQWEYACRSGSRSPWSVAEAELAGTANLADETSSQAGAPWAHEAWMDGFTVHAPVGSLAANAFGLHDMHGNVYEWCRDGHGSYGSERAGDGLNEVLGWSDRVQRGGSFNERAIGARSSCRGHAAPTIRSQSVGLRLARRL